VRIHSPEGGSFLFPDAADTERLAVRRRSVTLPLMTRPHITKTTCVAGP
jgi:hypothetical protein